jgi:hypothetical protein
MLGLEGIKIRMHAKIGQEDHAKIGKAHRRGGAANEHFLKVREPLREDEQRRGQNHGDAAERESAQRYSELR